MGYISFEHGYPKIESAAASLVELGSRDSRKRQAARQSLVHLGNAAVPHLINALHSPNAMMRWEAAKTLEEIRSPQAAPALVEELRDRDPGIRWLAGEALIALHEDAIRPLLQGLKDHIGSIWMRESALHVLHGLQKRNLLSQPLIQVMNALSGPEPEVVVPWVTYAAANYLSQRLM